MNGRRRHCVIADDVRLYREMLRRWMSELGFECHLSATGQGALAEAERCGTDLIVTDIDMPKINGIELTRFIRAHHRVEIRNIPILIISSLHDAQIDAFVRQFGGSGFCAKPLDKSRFVYAVTRIMENLPDYQRVADAGVNDLAEETPETDRCTISHLLRRIVRDQYSSLEEGSGEDTGECGFTQNEDSR